MTEVEPVLDFASSGRTGRRNALPDILGSPAGVSPSDLPLKLAEMSLNAGRRWAAGPALLQGTARWEQGALPVTPWGPRLWAGSS
uniref:IPKA inhibitor n=1 Tax=Apteryx owenii TaxID=8824 RepID=A0A8B9QAC2_APTOW